MLEKHNLSWELFSCKGRLPKEFRWVAEKRRDIITELHTLGMPWARMIEVTGLSLGAIQRGTRAMWNDASRSNRQKSAAKIGHAGKGKRKPWLSERLRVEWSAGAFDFHRGRVRSEQEREKLRLSALRPEVKQLRHESSLRRWQNPEYREHLLRYHRSQEVRKERSQAQARRVQEHPEKWCRGRGALVFPKKCLRSPVWARSSYERIVMDILDADPEVLDYVFELRVELPDGRWILPDFVVRYKDGETFLLEVKASWVLQLPKGHKIQRRLFDASSFAYAQGWKFRVLTEKDWKCSK